MNQARVHLFEQNKNMKNKQAKSSSDSIAYWSETATCVGVRLEDDESLTICAPHGVDDLMNLVVAPVPKPYQDLELFRRRVAEKKWNVIWPRLKIVKI